MEQPMVSVIMGVYNQWDGQILRDAVNSILNQTFRDFEFIIWDDGSCPEAAENVQALGGLDQRIIIAGREENRGLAFSLNECIRLAKGKYIARMDADDFSMPCRLERQVDFLESHPEYGWCGTSAELFDENGVWGLRPMPEIPQMADYFRYSPYIHPSVMFRRELFDQERGYLDTQETLRCEDYEIFMSLVGRGQKGYNLQESLFRYRETRESYRKRKIHYRINEAKTRYRSYKKLGILFPSGWFYALRPVAACVIPPRILEMIKRTEGKFRKKGIWDGQANTEGREYPAASLAVQSHTGAEPASFAGIGKIHSPSEWTV
ncbi:glycosyltransferase [Lachnospiraceae bacterium]|jgi:glycosyltransferase involved in cell wall biosynthesis|nr:glycosyltransferase [Lachnospiraceae bacterium]